MVLDILHFPFERFGDADVPERDDHAVDAVVQGPVRHDAHGEPAAVARADGLFREAEFPQHLAGIVRQIRIDEIRREVGDGPADVAGDKIDDFGRLGGETADVKLSVEKQRGDVGAVEEVFHVIIRP